MPGSSPRVIIVPDEVSKGGEDGDARLRCDCYGLHCGLSMSRADLQNEQHYPHAGGVLEQSVESRAIDTFTIGQT